MKLSILMPVYNEIETIDEIIRRVMSAKLPARMSRELIIVDDCSTDGTRHYLRERARKRSRSLRVVFHEVNQGKAAALQTAIRYMNGDYVIIQDADLEYNPSEYGRLLRPLVSGQADVVYGSRYIRSDATRVLYFWHTLMNRGLTLLSNLVTNLDLTDMETCYKAMKCEILRHLVLKADRFGIEPELTAKLAKLRAVIYEVPVSYYGRTAEEGKKIGWRDGLEALWAILRFTVFTGVRASFTKDPADFSTLTSTYWQIKRRSSRGMEHLSRHSMYRADRVAGLRDVMRGNVLLAGHGSANYVADVVEQKDVRAVTVLEEDEAVVRRLHYQYLYHEKPVTVRAAAVGQLDRRRCYDLIFLVNVLEHAEDDDAVFRQIARRLVSGGTVAAVVPAHASLMSEMDRGLGHYRRYGRPRLDRLARENGLTVERISGHNPLGGWGWWWRFRVMKRRTLPLGLIRFISTAAPLLRLCSLPFYLLPLRMSYVMKAKKNGS
jgi:glycosyltransferase involved in cell wall biosynthesis